MVVGDGVGSLQARFVVYRAGVPFTAPGSVKTSRIGKSATVQHLCILGSKFNRLVIELNYLNDTSYSNVLFIRKLFFPNLKLKCKTGVNNLNMEFTALLIKLEKARKNSGTAMGNLGENVQE